MSSFYNRLKLAIYVEGYCAEKGISDNALGIISVLAMHHLLDEEAITELLIHIDEKEPEWLSGMELKEGTYKIWCVRRNSVGDVIKRFVYDTKYVRKAYALKYAQKTLGMSRPSFEYEVSIECPWNLELEVEEC